MRLFGILYVLIAMAAGPPSEAAASDRVLREKLTAFAAKVESEKTAPDARIALFVQEVGAAAELFAHNGSEPLVPASLLKVIPTFAALRSLGAEYRFPTEVFIDRLPKELSVSMDRSSGVSATKKPEWFAGNLYVRGYGDPSMIDERLWELARTVARRGVREIQHLVIDDTLFIDAPAATGPESYAASLSATSLNHNSFAIHISPSGATRPAFVELSPGAPYTLVNRVKSLQAGESSILISQSRESANYNPALTQSKLGSFRVLKAPEISITVQGYIGVDSPPETEYRSVPYPASYFGSVLRSYLAAAGVTVQGETLFGETPSGAKLLFAYQSEQIAQVLHDLNHYSSNFIGGQLLFALGQDTKGFFRQGLGLQRLQEVLTGLGFREDSFTIVDASGLDRRNRLTAQQIGKVLLEAHRDFSLMPDFIHSFSRYGRTGTLKQRELLNQEILQNVLKREVALLQYRAASIWAKTGTLDGVSSLGGYLELPNGGRAVFAVIINGIEKSRAALIEDEFVRLLIGIDARQ